MFKSDSFGYFNKQTRHWIINYNLQSKATQGKKKVNVCTTIHFIIMKKKLVYFKLFFVVVQ
jgi:hypothetical protein